MNLLSTAARVSLTTKLLFWVGVLLLTMSFGMWAGSTAGWTTRLFGVAIGLMLLVVFQIRFTVGQMLSPRYARSLRDAKDAAATARQQ